MSQLDLEEIQRVLDAAHRGWADASADLVALGPDWLRALLAEVRELRAWAQQVEAAYQEALSIPLGDDGTPPTPSAD